MKVRILLLVLAVIFGLAAVFGVMFYLNNLRATLEKEGEKVDVLVASQDIPKDTPVGEVISKNLVEIKKIPLRYVVKEYITSLDKYLDYFILIQVNKGEQMTPEKFIKPSDITFSFEVPEGMVAVSIPFNEIIGVSNLLTVGDRVNVIATFQPDQEQQQISSDQISDLPETQNNTASNKSAVVIDTTKTLLWNIEILYIGEKTAIDVLSAQNKGLLSSSGSNEEPVEIKTVTLAVTPEQAEKLVFSEELGTVWLALLPVGGIKETDTPGRTLDNIFIK